MSCASNPRSADALGLNAGTRPKVGFTVATPHAKEGKRSDPPMSFPWWIGPNPIAAAADAPPEEPPGDVSSSHGLKGSAAKRVVRGPAHGELRGVGAPHDDRAGFEEVAHHRRVVRSDEIRERGEAVRGRLSSDVHVFLDGDRNTVQRSECLAAVHLPVLPFGGPQRLFGAVGDDRVDASVVHCDPLEHRLRYLDARDLARPYHRGKLDRAPPPHILIHVDFLLYVPGRD